MTVNTSTKPAFLNESSAYTRSLKTAMNIAASGGGKKVRVRQSKKHQRHLKNFAAALETNPKAKAVIKNLSNLEAKPVTRRTVATLEKYLATAFDSKLQIFWVTFE